MDRHWLFFIASYSSDTKIAFIGYLAFPPGSSSPRTVSSLPISSSKHEFVDYDQSVDDY